MKIILDISSDLLADLRQMTGAKTDAGAIAAAEDGYVSRERMAAMTGYLGTFEDFITGAELTASRV